MTIHTQTDVLRRQRSLAWMLYSLYGLGAVFSAGTVTLVAVIFAHVKVRESQPSVFREHFRWLYRTFWFGFPWLVVGVILVFTSVFALVGSGILFLVMCWQVYRLVHGSLRLVEEQSPF